MELLDRPRPTEPLLAGAPKELRLENGSNALAVELDDVSSASDGGNPIGPLNTSSSAERDCWAVVLPRAARAAVKDDENILPPETDFLGPFAVSNEA